MWGQVRIGDVSHERSRMKVQKDLEKGMVGLSIMTKATLTKARDLMKRYYDRHHGKEMVYKARDLVWLEKTNIRTTCPMK